VSHSFHLIFAHRAASRIFLSVLRICAIVILSSEEQRRKINPRVVAAAVACVASLA